MEKPVCKQCESEGKRYSVDNPVYGVTTLMGITPDYWDEDGKYHKGYNPNTTTYTYHCSNGHSWSETT